MARTPEESTQAAYEALLQQFEENPNPDWESLQVWRDACIDIGEDRLAKVAAWMAENRKWPGFAPTYSDPYLDDHRTPGLVGVLSLPSPA